MVFTPDQIEVFLLVFARIVGLFFSAPLLSAKSIPSFVKTALAIWLAYTFWFVIPVPYGLPPTSVTFVINLMVEAFIGFIIGYICNLIILSVQAAGDMIDVQMGLSIANILSPTTGQMATLIGSLTFYVALTIFLVVDGHHMMLSAINQSFTAMPINSAVNFSKGAFLQQLIDLMAFFWLTAIRLAAPTILLIFLVDFSFGLVSRVAPQVNVFMLGFQVKPIVGLLGVMITMPLMAKHVGGLISSMLTEVAKMFVFLK